MSCVNVNKFTCFKVKHALEGGNEHLFAIGFAKEIVDLGKHCAKVSALCGVVFDKGFTDDHKESRGNTLTRNVGYNDCQVLVVHHKEVVKVASYLFCGVHGCVNIDFTSIGECGENTWKHGFLNVCGNVQFRRALHFTGCRQNRVENQNELDNEDNTNGQIQREEPEMTGENAVCVGEKIDNVETNVRNRGCGYKGCHFSFKRIYHFSEMLAKEVRINEENDRIYHNLNADKE